MDRLVITTDSKGQKIAVLFDLSKSWGEVKANSAEQMQTKLFSDLLFAQLKDATDSKGNRATAEDISEAMRLEWDSLNTERKGSGKGWAVKLGDHMLHHRTKGTMFMQGIALDTLVIEAVESAPKKVRGSRNGVTLARKAVRSLLPVALWKMVSLTNAQIFSGMEAVEKWNELQGI